MISPYLLKCFLHNFETFDIEAWDRHCYYSGHKNVVWENGEKVEEPYPRHHMRDAWRNGEQLSCSGENNICAICTKELGREENLTQVPMNFTGSWQMFTVHERCENEWKAKHGDGK